MKNPDKVTLYPVHCSDEYGNEVIRLEEHWHDCDEEWEDGVEYIRADLVPQWMPIETAPKDGTEFQVLAYNKAFKDYYWVPCARFETTQSRVPSAYLYESQKWEKFKLGQAAYWMPPPTPPPAT